MVPAWQRVLDPLAEGGIGWSDTRRIPNLVPHQLTDAELSDWVEWIVDVDARRVTSVEVAIRRTIRAAIERADPSDALVDAVIAWENIVGSREGEPTLRVSAALAWLLEPNGGKRGHGRGRSSGSTRSAATLCTETGRWGPTRPPRQATRLKTSRSHSAVLIRDRHELLRDCRDAPTGASR